MFYVALLLRRGNRDLLLLLHCQLGKWCDQAVRRRPGDQTTMFARGVVLRVPLLAK